MLVYTPPGVYVSEVTSPTIISLLSAPANPCIIAPARGYIVSTDQIRLTGTTPVVLPGFPAGATLQAVVSVKDAIDPSKGAVDGSGYVLTTDYTISLVNGTITRVGAGGITDGSLVNVTYQYVSSKYFEPIRLDDISSIEQRFGPAYTSDGSGISSPLSFAAGIAFENGAPNVVCQPLFIRTIPGDSTTAKLLPTPTQIATASTWSDTLFALRDFEDINILVPIIGQSTLNVTDAGMLGILEVVQDHLVFMKTQDDFIVALCGEDSSSDHTQASLTTLRTHATTLAGRYSGSVAEGMALVAPSRFGRVLPFTANQIDVGGQYVAAGIAGIISSNPVFSPLTRKQLSNFVQVSETRTKAQKNDDASNGLLVVDQQGSAVQIRHAVTLDTTTTARRELSVVRSKYRMIQSIRLTLDTQVIGKIVADAQAPIIVKTTVIGVLQQLKQLKELVDYGAVSARISSLDPTTIEVRFSYKPSFPVNYINVVFSLDLTGADVTSTNAAVAS